MLDQINVAALQVLAAIPNPGQGEAPPGSEKLTTLLKWGSWVGYLLCVLGVIVAGAGMALQHSGRVGGGAEHGSRLGWVLAGSLLIGSASALVTAMA